MGSSFFTHLECGSGCGDGPFDPREAHFLCPTCKLPMLARYDLQAARSWKKESLSGRAPNMWRYRELLPLLAGDDPITLGEGFTPLIHARRLGATVGLDRLLIKDESLNPTNSFKARGLSAAISRARALRAETVFLPTAGNAGNAAAAYAAAAGMKCEVFIPSDAKQPFIDECRLYGANVTLVDGLITEAGKTASETAKPRGWYEVSTFREVGRCEGKKTMGYELAEQLDWTLPDWIIYPTGGGTGMVGMWKAFDEMEEIGWLSSSKRPKMVTVQPEGCPPIVNAFQRGAATAGLHENASTIADGLRGTARDRRFPDPAHDPRQQRHGSCGQRRRDDRRHAGHGPRRGHLGRARRRRVAERGAQTGRRRADQAARDGRAVQHGWRVEVSRPAEARLKTRLYVEGGLQTRLIPYA